MFNAYAGEIGPGALGCQGIAPPYPCHRLQQQRAAFNPLRYRSILASVQCEALSPHGRALPRSICFRYMR